MWWAKMDNFIKNFNSFYRQAAPPADKPCAGNHAAHMCALASRADFAKVTAAAGKPAFVCMNCGRVADAAGSLCNPIGFDRITVGVPNL